MNKVTSKYLLIGLLVLQGLLSCDNGKKTDEKESQEVVENCDSISVEDFNDFLGLSYGSEERELSFVLGSFTSGLMTEDSSAFIYHFNRVDRVPVSVWVNSETSKVITIFVEVVSLGENFQSDLDDAIDEFKITECDASWFGLSAEDIKNKLGEPSEEAVSKEGVTLLSYDSEDMLITATFKVYEEQDNQCSSVSINWFY